MQRDRTWYFWSGPGLCGRDRNEHSKSTSLPRYRMDGLGSVFESRSCGRRRRNFSRTCKWGRRQLHFRQLLGVQQTYRAMQRTCSCGNGRGYKTTQALQKHQNTAGHKRKCDPDFAAAEEADRAANRATREKVKKATREADKAANKATRGEKEKVRKAGEKETARKAGDKETARKAGDKEKERKANRGQRDDNIKRKRSKA
jgi:hypothetical protein